MDITSISRSSCELNRGASRGAQSCRQRLVSDGLQQSSSAAANGSAACRRTPGSTSAASEPRSRPIRKPRCAIGLGQTAVGSGKCCHRAAGARARRHRPGPTAGPRGAGVFFDAQRRDSREGGITASISSPPPRRHRLIPVGRRRETKALTPSSTAGQVLQQAQEVRGDMRTVTSSS
jgi:hypothetical protein